MSDQFALPQGKTVFQAPRLTTELVDAILSAEPGAVALRSDDQSVIGVELPLSEGITYTDGRRTRTALIGDRVCRDRFGDWLVVRA